MRKSINPPMTTMPWLYLTLHVYGKTIPAIRLGNIRSEEESGIKKFVVAEPLEQYRSRIHLP